MAEPRGVETVDQELRLLAAVRTSTRELGGKPSSAAADQLLDERLTMEAPAAAEPSLGLTPPTPGC